MSIRFRGESTSTLTPGICVIGLINECTYKYIFNCIFIVN